MVGINSGIEGGCRRDFQKFAEAIICDVYDDDDAATGRVLEYLWGCYSTAI